MFLRSKLLFTASLASTALALNDWSKPCFNGECSYDLPSHAGGPVGSLKIVSSNYNLPVRLSLKIYIYSGVTTSMPSPILHLLRDGSYSDATPMLYNKTSA